MNNFNKNRGITLIALVVTIIVLLILAGISIAMLTEQNGILNRASEAKEKTMQAQQEEQSILDDYESQISSYVGIDWEKAKANAKAPEEQKEERNNGVIGIGTDGKPVNMDLWEYTLLEDGTYGLNTKSYLIDGGKFTVGYRGTFSEDGRIIGTVPQYISQNNGTTFAQVTSMKGSLDEFDELVIAPEIPDTVTVLASTFWGCKNLKVAPKIPNNVTNMWSTFYGCSSLADAPNIPNNVENMQSTFMKSAITKAPNIPEGVKNMLDTFSDCLNLTEASTIPSTVTLIRQVYYNCPKLQGEIKINAQVSGKIAQSSEGYSFLDYDNALKNSSTENGLSLKVTGICPILDEIVENANNPNITLK